MKGSVAKDIIDSQFSRETARSAKYAVLWADMNSQKSPSVMLTYAKNDSRNSAASSPTDFLAFCPANRDDLTRAAARRGSSARKTGVSTKPRPAITPESETSSQ